MSNIKRISSFIYGFIFIVLSILLLISNLNTNHSSTTVTEITNLAPSSQSELIETNIAEGDISDKYREENNTVEFSQAVAISKDGKVNQAIELYQKILSANKNHQAAAINIGILMKRHHGCSKAMKSIQYAASISRGRRLSSALSMQASCLIKDNEFKRAIPLLERSIEFRPNHSSTWERLAIAFEGAEFDGKRILTTYQRALSLNSKSVRLRLLVAKFQQKSLDFHGSNTTLKSRYRDIKKIYRAQYMLAWNYLELEKFNNAKKHLKIAKSLDKSQHGLINAMTLHSNKQYNDSIELIKTLNKRSAIYLYLLGLNYKAQNWTISANKQFKRAGKRKSLKSRSQFHVLFMNRDEKISSSMITEALHALPKHVILDYGYYLLGKNLYKKGEAHAAKENLGNITYPHSNTDINITYAKVLWSLEERSRAFDLLKSVISNNQSKRINIDSSIRLLAKYSFDQGLTDDAHSYIKSISPKNYKKKDIRLLAQIYLNKGDTVQALKTLISALETWPDDVELRLLLADAFEKNKRPEESRKQLSLVLKLDKNNTEANQKLSKHL